MKKIFCLSLAVALSFGFVSAQDKKSLDSVDNVIMIQVIHLAEAKANKKEPDWSVLSEQLQKNYSQMQTDRAINKAQIYYYFDLDWQKFSTALIRFTNKYEDKDDLNLMNTNAQFILQHSENKEDLREAQSWMKHAIDKEPSNTTYQGTYKALSDKI